MVNMVTSYFLSLACLHLAQSSTVSVDGTSLSCWHGCCLPSGNKAPCPVGANIQYIHRQYEHSFRRRLTVSKFVLIPQMSSDYETMMPSVRTDQELCCSCSAPGCPYLLDPLPPPPDLCSHLKSKNRESAVSLGLSDYVDVDASGHLCQYQHLDPSRIEDHVYHSLHGDGRPKDGPLRVQEQVGTYF